MEISTLTIHSEKRYPQILTQQALQFLEALHGQFESMRNNLLLERASRANLYHSGVLPSKDPSTAALRNAPWQCAAAPKDLRDRRVEITGPVERKMVINALSSGANCFMADFEDSNSPTWSNCMEGQENLKGAVAGNLSYTSQEGKHYALGENPATLLVRPRGLHLEERHLRIGCKPLSASLVDFGLFFFHNAKALIEKGSGPYFYLPKLEHYLEARWWNKVFEFAQNYLSIPQGTIKATVLIETLPAVYCLDEILYELRYHSAGLNCGRWDYIFSWLKVLGRRPESLLPDRSQITMDTPMMKAYTQKVVEVCHRRGVHAMGGMAAQIPIKEDREKNALAMEKVRKDKLREVLDGHDGTWVAHPGLVSLAKEVFDTHMPGPNQIDKKLKSDMMGMQALLTPPNGSISEQGARTNINISLLYLESWLEGRGAAALYHLMEDAATAEISRMQIWQWLYHGATTKEGVRIDRNQVEKWIALEFESLAALRQPPQNLKTLTTARSLLESLVFDEVPPEFLTLRAYKLLK